MIKKIITGVLILGAIFFLLIRYRENALLQELPPNTLIVFSQKGCGHCHQALDYLNTEFQKRRPDIPVQVLDVANKQNLSKLWTLLRRNKIPSDSVGTPILVWNGQIHIGWDNRMPATLNRMIKHQTVKNP